MRIRKGNALILGIALLMGTIAAVLAKNWLQSHSRHSAEATTTIVVATAPMGFGIPLADDKVAEVRWASDTLPQGAFATKQELLKDGRRVVLTPIDRNEPILR